MRHIDTEELKSFNKTLCEHGSLDNVSIVLDINQYGYVPEIVETLKELFQGNQVEVPLHITTLQAESRDIGLYVTNARVWALKKRTNAIVPILTNKERTSVLAAALMCSDVYVVARYAESKIHFYFSKARKIPNKDLLPFDPENTVSIDVKPAPNSHF